jgi:hypothetical protein
MYLGACFATRQTKGNIRSKGTTMFIQSRIILSGAIILATVSATMSKDGGIPNLNIQKHCRADQAATDAFYRDKNVDSSSGPCILSEQHAREQLVRDWATFSALDKASCVHPAAYSPSYFEWIACIDTRVYVRQMRKEHPVATPVSKVCPMVKWQSNGEITSAVVCGSMR